MVSRNIPARTYVQLRNRKSIIFLCVMFSLLLTTYALLDNVDVHGTPPRRPDSPDTGVSEEQPKKPVEPESTDSDLIPVIAIGIAIAIISVIIGISTRKIEPAIGIPNWRKMCFIATASYGSALADEVQFLRRYRENVVKRKRYGRAFLAAFEKFYYSFSPRLAKLIEGRYRLRYLSRIFVVDPIVDMLLITSFTSRLARRKLSYSSINRKKLLTGIFMRGIGGWLYSISWIVWNVFLAYSFLNSQAIIGAAIIWIPMMSGLILTRVGSWMHKDIDFNNLVPI